jgi:hypothetical protein
VLGIDTLRGAEQDPVGEAAASLRGVCSPGREPLGGHEVLGVRRLVRLPLEHRVGEGELVECTAQAPGYLLLQRRAIEGRCLVGLDLEHRAPLHELALDAEQRRQPVMALDQRLPLGLDVEQVCHEPVDVRRYGQQQLGLLLVGEARGIGAGCLPAGVQLGVLLAQPGVERLVDLHQPGPVVEVFEAEVERELQGGGGGHRKARKRAKAACGDLDFIGSRIRPRIRAVTR